MSADWLGYLGAASSVYAISIFLSGVLNFWAEFQQMLKSICAPALFTVKTSIMLASLSIQVITEIAIAEQTIQG